MNNDLAQLGREFSPKIVKVLSPLAEFCFVVRVTFVYFINNVYYGGCIESLMIQLTRKR